MSVIDLSPPVSGTAAHWPGDAGYARTDRWRISAGDTVTVGTVTTTGHIGAHIDAPAHVSADGATVDCTPLGSCIGPCVVIDVRHLVDRTRTPHGYAAAREVIALLAQVSGGHAVERLLLRHRDAAPCDDAPRPWYPESPGLDPELVQWFGEQGGKLIGVDLDSFDPLEHRDLPAHRAALAAGVVILEGLLLDTAPVTTPATAIAHWPDLSALPVHWRGTDAAPVRAVLRTRLPRQAGSPDAAP